jgi:hypothetical protein
VSIVFMENRRESYFSESRKEKKSERLDLVHTNVWDCWAQAKSGEKGLFLEDKSNFGEEQLAGKATRVREKLHEKEESMQVSHVGKPNHVRVRVFVIDCNDR